MSSDATTWRKAVIWGLAALVLLAASLWILNTTSFPLELARRAVGLVSESTGWSIEIGGARFVGPTRLLIEDVEIDGPEDVRGSAPRAYVAFNPLSLLGIGKSDFDWGRVDLVGPHFIVPGDALKVWQDRGEQTIAERTERAPSHEASPSVQMTHTLEINVVRGTLEEKRASGPARLWRAEGEFLVRVGGPVRLRARKLDLELRTDNVTISAAASGEGLDAIEWHATGPADLVLSMITEFPWQITGAMSATGTLDLSNAHGALSMHIANGDVQWGNLGPSDWIAFESANVEIEHSPDAYVVRRLELRRGEASVIGEGEVRPASESGGGEPHLEIAIAAKGLSLPDDIPSVRPFGLSGDAEFTGVLSGTLGEPEISGRLKVSDGSVWHRPVDQGEGVILLRKGLFRFGKTELVRGDAKYDLQGEWSGAPARTTIKVTSSNGDIKEMLLAAGIDLDVTGEVDGTFSVDVDDSGPRVEGEGEGRGLEVLGQPFDSVSGRFVWTPEHSRLQDVRLRLGEGRGTASGEIVNGSLNIAITTERWPAPQIASAGSEVSGWVSFTGSVIGSMVDPMVQGRVRGGQMTVGNWTIEEPVGDVVIARELIHITRLRGKGAGNGVYELSGDIRSWTEAPSLDLDIAVERASLSGILNQAGLRLPALLFDGEVSGSITLEGAADRPLADFDLSLSDELGLGDPMRLRFRVDDGKIKLGRLADLFGLSS